MIDPQSPMENLAPPDPGARAGARDATRCEN
jgi:hypothetical protein